MQEIISGLKNEFELFEKGATDPSKEFAEKFGKDLKLSEDCIEFLKLHSGMKRLAKDRYFTFQIFPISKMYLLDQMGDMPEEEKLEFLALEPDDFSGDWITVASEGEYGVYAMNCNEKSPKFGMVYGIIINIPEQFCEWENFTEFLEGLQDYCRSFPLADYRREKPGSDPWYGISF